MPNRFEFATAARVIVGWGAHADVGAIASTFGRSALLVTGRAPDRAVRIERICAEAGVSSTRFPVDREPDVAIVRQGAEIARQVARDVVIAVGGGSVIDTAKAVAGLTTNREDLLDYLEVVGHGRPLERAALPVIALPTTAGTGAEVTRNAVIGVPERRVKVSLRSPFLMPAVALVDPQLTVDLPPHLTAITGIDALTQLIESYVSCRATPMTDALCEKGLPRAARALRRAVADGSDVDARTDMAVASLWSGMALANAGLGAVHGFAGPVGGASGAAHGAICAALLPHVCAANVRALEGGRGDAQALARFDEVGRMLVGAPSATRHDAIAALHQLLRDLSAPSLTELGFDPADLDAVVEQAQRASSMKGNPVALTPGELRETVERAM